MFDVDILIVARRFQHLKKCVGSVLAHNNCGILVVINGYNKEIADYLQSVRKENPLLRYVLIDRKVEKSRARNTALENAVAEIVYFIDDDAYFEADNVSLLSEKFKEHPDVSIIGGPNLTPPGSGFFQRAAGYVLSSAFTAFKMRLRFARGARDESCDDAFLTLCNLALKRQIVKADGISFDPRLYYNEENLFLQQLKKKGRGMLYCPELSVYHERRKDLVSFAEQVFRSGEGRAVMTMIMPQSLSAVYPVPLIFTAYLVSLIFFHAPVYLAPFGIYIVLCFLNSLLTVIREKETVLMLVTMFFMPFVAHIAYGEGFAWGLGRHLLWRK